MAKLYDDVKVIDADTHFTEPPDLWTSRAPAAYKDRILHIEQRNGVPTWVVDGAELGFAKGGGVVDHDGGKIPFLDSMEKGKDGIVAITPAMGEFSAAFAYKQYGVPYHPGALKYYKEHNLSPRPIE